MNPDSLLIPYFSRLSEYFGFWLVEPSHAEKLYQLIRSMDLRSHVQASLANPKQVDIPLQLIPGRGNKSIGVIRGVGTLMKGQSSMGGTSTIAMRRAIRSAAADPNVSGILVALDTPGGSVAGTQDLANDVRAASRKKPTWAFADDLTASAGYWIASQADQVIANSPTALVGSIGTVMHLTDSSAATEKTGVKEIAIASGPLKAFGGGLGVTDEQSNYLQSLVNSLQHEFSGAVQKARGLSDTRMKEVATGAVFTAPEAQRLKLIDGIKSFDATIAELAKAN